MKTFAITGDRSAHPGMVLPVVLVEIAKLQQEHGPIRLVSGLEKGVEAAVRLAADLAGIPFQDLQWLTKDWPAYGEAILNAGAEKILVIHGDPHVSNMYPGLLETAEALVELVQPDLYVS